MMRSQFENAPVTGVLLVMIFAVFGVEWWTGALHDNEVLFRLGAIAPEMISQHQYWRAIAAMFLHANPVHIIANAWGLWQLGTLYETMFGSARFATIYLISGIVASFGSAMFTRGISVGASGAILGILGAFIFSIKRSPRWKHDPFTKRLIPQFIFWGAVNILLPLKFAQIDGIAHAAGLLAGLVLGFLLPHRVPPPPPGGAIIDVG
jgi:rhomboid protease GluP